MPRFDDLSYDHMINHPHDPHEPKHAHPELEMPGHPRWAPCNDDELPIISRVGRGISGDGYVVKPKCGNYCDHPCDGCEECEHRDSCCCEEFYLEGYYVDGAHGEETLDWTSGNLSGGYLHDLNHTYRVRPWNDPPTFNATFIYHKPPCCSWSWVTPNIPYCWDEKGPYPEKMVGSGVATVWVRTDGVNRSGAVGSKGDVNDSTWIEKLVYPQHTTRENFNAPEPEEDWTTNLTFGYLHGDVLVPNIYDVADDLGFSADTLYRTVDGEKEKWAGGIRTTHGTKDSAPEGTSDNLKQYIDDNDVWLLNHLHDDLGFDDAIEGDGDSGDYSVKDYVDWWIDYIIDRLPSPEATYSGSWNDGDSGHLHANTNWNSAMLGGTWFLNPATLMGSFSFCYRDAIHNGTKLNGDPHPLDEVFTISATGAQSLVNTHWGDGGYEMYGDDLKNFLPKEDHIFHNAAMLAITGGGGQSYTGSTTLVSNLDIIFTTDGQIKLGSDIHLSPYYVWDLEHGEEPKIIEWDVMIVVPNITISLDDNWNSDHPWEIPRNYPTDGQAMTSPLPPKDHPRVKGGE